MQRIDNTPDARRSTTAVNPLTKVLTVVGTGLVVAIGVAFSLVFIAIAAVAGSVLVGYLWWRTRALRRSLREAQSTAPTASDGGRIIEGEVIRESSRFSHIDVKR